MKEIPLQICCLVQTCKNKNENHTRIINKIQTPDVNPESIMRRKSVQGKKYLLLKVIAKIILTDKSTPP